MTFEQKLFFTVLSDHINGRDTTFEPSTFDHSVFYNFVRRQNLLGIFYIQCKKCLDPNSELYKKLYNGFCSDVFYSVNQEASFAELTAKFKEADIQLLAMKGLDVAKYYPVQRLRTMGDIDLIIHQSDREKSDQIMKQMGYVSMVDNHAVWTYSRDVVQFEIHDHMMYDPLANDVDYRAFFDNVWDYSVFLGERYSIKPEFHFLYLITHTAKHIINKGYGIRGFLDLVFMSKNEPDMDWDWITEKLNSLKLLAFTKTCFAFCERWFDIKMPIPASMISEQFFSDTTQKIFLDGLWGYDNAENVIGSQARTARSSNLPYWITALNMTRKRLFPPYRDMQLIPWYSFVDGKPWLLPAAWIYRFWYCARNKRKYSSDLLSTPFTKVDAIHNREAMIDQWGL